MEAGGEAADRRRVRGLDWLKPLQVLDIAGDWAAQRARTCGRAAGRSSTPTRIIPISTTPPSW